MTLTYRNAGAWGAGKGARLTSAEIDDNFYTLVQMIDALTGGGFVTGADNPVVDVTVSGATLTIYFADTTTETRTISAPFAAPYREVTTTSYTLLTSDIGAFLEFTHAAGCAITVPSELAGGTTAEWHFCQGDSSAGVSVLEDGTTVSGVSGYENSTATPGAVMTLKRKATNAYRLFGGPMVPTSA